MAKAKQVESWGDIPRATFDAFYKAVEKLREEMIPRDYDGDSPIQYLIINRATHEPLSYFAVPRPEIYSYITHGYLEVHPDKLTEIQDETERMLAANVDMAAKALDRYMSLKHHQNRVSRESQRPFADRIKETCSFCKKRVGFDPLNVNDFYQKTRTRFPDFPARYHSNGEECKAFDLRKAEFSSTHPEYNGPKPEKRWCMNPDCRCKLPDYNSKKDVKDRNICVNPRCGMDNSKFYPEKPNATD